MIFLVKVAHVFHSFLVKILLLKLDWGINILTVCPVIPFL
jgi:hypothetical protein